MGGQTRLLYGLFQGFHKGHIFMIKGLIGFSVSGAAASVVSYKASCHRSCFEDDAPLHSCSGAPSFQCHPATCW